MQAEAMARYGNSYQKHARLITLPSNHMARKPRKAVAFRKEFRHIGLKIVILDGAQQVNANGVPETAILLRPSESEILDTRCTTGLCGPAATTPAFATFSSRKRKLSASRTYTCPTAQAAFYAFHFVFIAKGPVATLGIARHSISRRWEASAAIHARCTR
jgi:hypothetical protein